jgi:two-component system phosphate regulon response regulator OmpR
MSRAESHQSYASRPHILVVDDDARIRDLVCRYLSDHGFVTIGAGQAAEARAVLAETQVDAAVIDVMMPGESGIELTADLSRRFQFPVILLTALGEAHDRIAGLQSGADDYLSKPFEPQELVLRLQALLRRTMQPVNEARQILIGAKVFDVQNSRLVDEAGVDVSLTEAEQALLAVLASRPGQAFSREALAQACRISGARAVDVQITRLRRKIEKDTRNPQYLKTLRGQGYLLRAEEMSG